MHRVEFAPAPIEHEERALILGGKLRAVAKHCARGRPRADVERGWQVVGVKLGPLAGSIAPAKLRAAHDMVDARGAIPRRIEVILHVRVVGEKLAVAIDRRVEDIAEAGGEGLELFPIRRHAIDDAAGPHDIAHEAATVRHPRQQMILAPDRRHLRTARELSRLRPIAADEIQRFAIRRGQHRVDAMIALRLDRAQRLYLVEPIVAVAIGDPVKPARYLRLVVIHADVERTEGEQHPIHRADVGGHLLNLRRIERLPGGRRGKAVEPAVLVAGIDATLVIVAEIHPRALLAAGHGVEQLHLEVLRRLDARDRRGGVFADGLADRSLARCRLGLLIRPRLRDRLRGRGAWRRIAFGSREDAADEEWDEEGERSFHGVEKVVCISGRSDPRVCSISSAGNLRKPAGRVMKREPARVDGDRSAPFTKLPRVSGSPLHAR